MSSARSRILVPALLFSLLLSPLACYIDWSRPDNDGDGFSEWDGDCDDENPLVHPDAWEGCDGVDSNCDGEVDEWDDLDGDWHTQCGADGVYDTQDDDCDDRDESVYPGAFEHCDGKDNDCDGEIDEDYPDIDGDGDPDCEESGFRGSTKFERRWVSEELEGLEVADEAALGGDGDRAAFGGDGAAEV